MNVRKRKSKMNATGTCLRRTSSSRIFILATDFLVLDPLVFDSIEMKFSIKIITNNTTGLIFKVIKVRLATV